MTASSVDVPCTVFPRDLEEALVALSARQLGLSGRELTLALERAAGRLSDLFTVDREPDFGGYAGQPDLLLAYSLFFFPQTFVRTAMVMAELFQHRRWAPCGEGPLRLLDLGAGTGAAGLSISRILSTRLNALPIELTAVDQAGESLQLLEEIGRAGTAHWPGLRIRTQRGDLGAPVVAEGGYDGVVVSFALNEAVERQPGFDVFAWLSGLLRVLKPGGLLLILEPGTLESSERLEALRDRVATARVARILGPCLHARPCPLRESGTAWCHEVRKWTVPSAVEVLNRRLFRPVQFLKFSFLALSPGQPAEPLAEGERLTRLVSPLADNKGLVRAHGCSAAGEVHAYEAPTRGVSRAEVRALLAEIERGDIVEWPALRPLNDGRILRAEGLPQRAGRGLG